MSFVQIHEVGPRDGLQNEKGVISLGEKLAFINALVDAGLSRIEIGSFVSPKWVPQMSGTDAVLSGVPALDGQYDVLIPNMRGWDRFNGAEKPKNVGIAVFISATEGFSQANLNCSIAESLDRLAPVVFAAQAGQVPVRGYVSCVTDCPYEGQVNAGQVAQVVSALRQLAPMPVSLGDTIGKGTPERVDAMLRRVCEVAPPQDLAGHFHDTSGLALQNIEVSLDHGLRSFDACTGGLGGCPYAPGAPGNVATEDVVRLLHSKGCKTAVDETKLTAAVAIARGLKGRDAVSKD